MRACWIVSMLACFSKKDCRGPKALNTVCSAESFVPKIRFPFLPKDKVSRLLLAYFYMS